MKRTKENIIKLLKAKYDNCHALRHIYAKDGKKELADDYLHEAMAYSDVISLLTNKDYFDEMVNVYIDDIEKMQRWLI